MSLTRSARPQRASVSIATATTTAVVAAQTGKRIVLVNVVLTVASGQTIVWKSGTTVLSGAIESGYTAGDSNAGLLETAPGEALNITTTSTGAVRGHITYVVL